MYADVRDPTLLNPLTTLDGDDENLEFWKFIVGAGNMSNAVSILINRFFQCVNYYSYFSILTKLLYFDTTFGTVIYFNFCHI